jgi:hypothetical protein
MRREDIKQTWRGGKKTGENGGTPRALAVTDTSMMMRYGFLEAMFGDG